MFLGLIDFGLAPAHSHTLGEQVVWLLSQTLPAPTVQTAQGGGFHISHNPFLFSAKKVGAAGSCQVGLQRESSCLSAG